jgi:hypothetical protein
MQRQAFKQTTCNNQHLLEFFLRPPRPLDRHAKQFKTKLQAAGWDLVLYDPRTKSKSRTTGFSGTNDTRHQLPLMIKQRDLPQLAHTNAEPLLYLLQQRNTTYVGGQRMSERELLEALFNKEDPDARIRVLIDAGAQILEHDNRSLISEWLEIDHEAKAAVYFESDHKPWVLHRRGQRVPLLASLFAENLDGCLVYLDESHCRGTDLKLPTHARACLTLGVHLTKDALVQAAMRLRLLGQTQSVVFFAPPEVHQSVMDLRSSNRGDTPTSADVLRWLIIQTCNSLEQHEPLYNRQGTTHLNGKQAEIDNPDVLRNKESRERYKPIVQTPELQNLKQMYEPKNLRQAPKLKPATFHPALQGFVRVLEKRKLAFQDRGFAVHSSALEEVEQEREVEFEVESVREVQKPVHFEAWKYPRLHRDIKAFVVEGHMRPDSPAYINMFSTMQQTALGQKRNAIKSTATGLGVTTQFNRTIKTPEPNDNFLRPPQWLLWNRETEKGLIVHPEEADALIPLLRRHTQPCNTHLIVYSAPVTRRMLHFNSLDYYAIPTLPANFKIPNWVKIELGIFAGRLYFDWDEHEEMLGYFGAQAVDCDGPANERPKTFAKKPLTFCKYNVPALCNLH